jgi:endonuclease-3
MTLAAQTPTLRRGALTRLARIDRRLEAAYHSPESELGNQTDPLDECVYIVLSFQTDVARLKASWASLRHTFPSWHAVRRAPVSAIAKAIQESGLQTQKAQRIKALLRAVEREVGTLALDSICSMTEHAAEKFLLNLPGLSWKGARCVQLYSLGHERFPVDGNTFRIMQRAGVLPTTSVYRRKSVHDDLERAVSAARRRALHVNLVVHGQKTCTPLAPNCSACPINDLCPRVGVFKTSHQPNQQQRA